MSHTGTFACVSFKLTRWGAIRITTAFQQLTVDLYNLAERKHLRNLREATRLILDNAMLIFVVGSSF